MVGQYDLVIVGMGSAGVTAADFAATLDLRVAAIERGWPGGDRLWSGSVPSMSLLAAGKVAHALRHAGELGIRVGEPEIDLGAVWRRIRDVRARIAATDADPQRFVERGIEVIQGGAELTGANEVTVHREREADLVLSTRFVLLCTGSRPAGLDVHGERGRPASYLTTDTFFELEQPPTELVVVGGGPTGVELAQGCARLGIRTTLLEQGDTILAGDERSLTATLATILRDDGVDLRLGARATAIAPDDHGRGLVVHVEQPEEHPAQVTVPAVLVATGRLPNVEGLGLESLGIATNERGVDVDERGRTTVRSVYVAGDLAGRHRFAHSAGHEAVRAVRDMFFPGRGTIDELIPWCTFTDPELAHAGLTSDEAEERFGTETDVWSVDLERSDRARVEGTPAGAVVVVTVKDRIVGAHVLAPGAGEMIHELALAIRGGWRIGDLASLVHVAATRSSSIGQLAVESSYEKAQRLRWLVRRR